MALKNKKESSDEMQIISPHYYYLPETVFFGFTPLSFVDYIIAAVNTHTHKAVEKLQAFLRSKEPFDSVILDAHLSRAFDKGMQMSGTLLESIVDKNFDRWELYCLHKIFRLPKSVQNAIFPSDADSNESQPISNDVGTANLMGQVASELERLESLKKLNQKLAIDLKVLEKRENNLKACKNSLNLVSQIHVPQDGENTVASLKDHAAFIKKKFNEMEHTWSEVQSYEQHVNMLYDLYLRKQGSKSMNNEAVSAKGASEPGSIADALNEDAELERLMKKCPLDQMKSFISIC